MLTKIEELLQEVDQLTAQNTDELEALRIKYLSKKGIINALMADFRNVPADQKKQVGMKLNELKTRTQERIAALKETFESQDADMSDLDLTRTAYPIQLGTRHPLNIVRNQIIDIFSRLGFTIADGPEVEDEFRARPSGTRHARHLLRRDQSGRCDQEHHLAHAYQQRSGTYHGSDPAPYPRDLPGTRVPQRSHQLPRALLLPPSRGLVCGQERIVHRLEASLAAIRTRDVRTGNENPLAPVLLPVHRTQRGNGHQLPHLRRRRMPVLQIHRMGRDFGMRHGRPSRARRLRHR